MRRERRHHYVSGVTVPMWLLALLGALVAVEVRGVSACPLTVAVSRAGASTLQVSARNGLLSVEARAASWAQLLDAVSQATGTRFHLFSALPGAVTIAFQGLPAAQALERLFGPDTSYVIRFPEVNSGSASAAFPTEVWVLTCGPGNASEAASAQGARPRLVTEQTSPNDEVDKAFAANPQAAREAALSASSPEIRRRAILHFGWRADQEALDVLAQVVQDRDPVVRGHAVDALELFVDQPGMRRSTLQTLARLVDQHPRVREVLIHVMNTAEEAEVRHLAAHSLGVPSDDATARTVAPGPDRATAK